MPPMDSRRPKPHGRPLAYARVVLADRILPKLLLSPSLTISLVFVYSFIGITAVLSLSNSRLLPIYRIVGLDRYRELFASDVWWHAAANLAWFGVPFVLLSIVIGLFLAILLDQKIRGEGFLRAIYVYPLALSYVVTGVAWQWIFNPGFGLQTLLRDLGWEGVTFNWLGDPDRAIFCVVTAAVWQNSGFVMALFLSGMRGVNTEIIRAAQVDGATLPTIYLRIIIPTIRPVFFSVMLILAHITIKTFDLVIALTAGGPGTSSWLPANFMYTFAFDRSQLGLGAASAIMMLATVASILIPLMYLEARRGPMRADLNLSRGLIYTLLILFMLVWVFPVYVMLSTSLKDLEDLRSGSMLALPQGWTIAPWIKAWSGACTGVRCDGVAPFFFNSLIIVVPAVLISAIIGAVNGYILVHWRFRGSEVIFTLLLVGFFIPYQVVLLPMAQLLGNIGLANSLPGLIFVHVVYGIAFTTMLYRNFYVGVPAELIRAARVDGAGFFTIFFRIMVPLSWPVFAVGVIWQFTQVWNDFLFGVVFSGADSMPITVALNNLVNATEGVKEYNVDMAAAIIGALPTLLVYILGGRLFLRGLMAGALKG